MTVFFFLIGLWFYLFIYLFILFYFWLCWVFVSVQGLPLVAASRGHSSSRCAGLSPSRPLLLRSTGSRRAGSVVVAHGPSFSASCGIFPDQGSNPCPLHWQADSQPLCHQGSPRWQFLSVLFTTVFSVPGTVSAWNIVITLNEWAKFNINIGIGNKATLSSTLSIKNFWFYNQQGPTA